MIQSTGRIISFTCVVGVFAAGAGAQQAPTLARDPALPRPPALRPAVEGPSAGISTGHPLTTAAAFEILLKGGNAFDAGVASLLVGGVVEQDLYSLGGEALVLVYPKKEAKVTSIVGQGWAPKAVDVDWFLARGKTGPFRVDGEAYKGADGRVGVRMLITDEGESRAITSGSCVFRVV